MSFDHGKKVKHLKNINPRTNVKSCLNELTELPLILCAKTKEMALLCSANTEILMVDSL